MPVVSPKTTRAKVLIHNLLGKRRNLQPSEPPTSLGKSSSSSWTNPNLTDQQLADSFQSQITHDPQAAHAFGQLILEGQREALDGHSPLGIDVPKPLIKSLTQSTQLLPSTPDSATDWAVKMLRWEKTPFNPLKALDLSKLNENLQDSLVAPTAHKVLHEQLNDVISRAHTTDPRQLVRAMALGWDQDHPGYIKAHPDLGRLLVGEDPAPTPTPTATTPTTSKSELSTYPQVAHNYHPRAIGAAIGGLIGGGAGAASDSRHRLRNALLGTALGSALGLGAEYMAHG